MGHVRRVTFSVIAEPSRREILDLLRGGERAVNELVDEDRAAVLSCVPEEELERAFAVLERISDTLSAIEEDPLR